jgi:hypothetical protein
MDPIDFVASLSLAVACTVAICVIIWGDDIDP